MPSAIRWDPLLARFTARELHALLRGTRLRALRLAGDERDLVLLLEERTVLWRLHPRRGYLRVLPPVGPDEGDIRFRARIVRVHALPDERIVRFDLAASRSRPAGSVIVELLGNQWNALVTEGHDPETVRHVLWRRETARGARVGRPYAAPPAPQRRGVNADVSREAWVASLLHVPPEERAGGLVRTFAWTSPLNASALLGAAEVGDDVADEPDHRDDEEVARLALGHERWKRMAAAEARPDAVLVETDGRLQPYPFPLAGSPCRAAESLLAAFEECSRSDSAGTRETWGAVSSIGPSHFGRLRRAVDRAARREARLRDELASLEDPTELRRVGDLILARYGEIPAGTSHASLIDFEGTPVEVQLDPARAPHENAGAYYDRAAKSERAAEALPALLERASAERRRLETLLVGATDGSASEEEVREAIGTESTGSRGADSGPGLPYRTFRSSGGLEIRVGRNARSNDDLTFRHSSPQDIWLHARHGAGAHVILRWADPGSPPARDLDEAAVLAALHSQARTSGSVPVDWTLRKHVRKPRGSPPGRVVAERVKTLFVVPDSALLDRLAPAP